MAFQAETTHANTDVKPFWKQYRLFHAAWAQFCYTGAQIAIAGYFINYATEAKPGTSSALGAKFLAGAQASFAIGRFVGVGLMKFIRPRKVFLFFITMCIVFVAPSITQRGNTGIAMLYVTLFFESICFPTIVALGMRGLGKYSKRGSGIIVGGVSGGAVVPPILGATADAKNSTPFAMVVPLCFFVSAWTYALCVNFVKSYREPADRFSTTKVGIEEVQKEDEESGSPGIEERSEDHEKGGAAHFEGTTPEIQKM